MARCCRSSAIRAEFCGGKDPSDAKPRGAKMNFLQASVALLAYAGIVFASCVFALIRYTLYTCFKVTTHEYSRLI